MVIEKTKYTYMINTNEIVARCEPDCDTGNWECEPDYCIPDAYDICNPECNDDGGCDPHEDNW